MPPPTAPDHRDGAHQAGVVRVHYWAAARAAAGVEYDDLPVAGPVSLAEIGEAVLARHDSDRLRRVLEVCSVLVGERPAGTGDPAEVVVEPGDAVQYLPPFAGG